MPKINIHSLLNKVAAQESSFAVTRFVAPCVAGGRVRVRVAGFVQTFTPHPADFEGWGIFTANREGTAALAEEADLPIVASYLSALPLLRARLARPLQNRTWLAYPVAEGDMRQRFGSARPFPVHLVTDGAPFETVTVRGDGGGAWWFDDIDRRADPQPAEHLREALHGTTDPAGLHFPGLTPEMRTAYDLVAQQDVRFAALMAKRRQATAVRDRWVSDEDRLRTALEVGGGALRNFTDRGDYWLVEWATGNGERHTSAIGRADLTVLSAGVCLSGEDRNFDLQSLVRVIEQGTWGME